MRPAAAARLDAIEATLLDLVTQVVPAPSDCRGRGRPAILPAAWLGTGLLVCLLRGDRSFRAIWRRLTVTRSPSACIAGPPRSWRNSSGTRR